MTFDSSPRIRKTGGVGLSRVLWAASHCLLWVLSLTHLALTDEGPTQSLSDSTLSSLNLTGQSTVSPGVPGREWYLPEYPNPKKDPVACGRNHVSFLCDPDNILSEQEALDLDEEIKRTCEDTTCPCSPSCHNTCPGYSIAIAMVNKMAMPKYIEVTSKVLQVECTRWAKTLQKTMWHFGSCDEDIVIMVSKEDKQVFTSTGRAAQRALADSCITNVFQATRHHFKAGNFSQGLLEMVRHYRSSMISWSCTVAAKRKTKSNLNRVSHSEEPSSSSSGGTNIGKIVGIIVGGVAGALLLLGVTYYCCARDSGSRSSAPSSGGHQHHTSVTYYGDGQQPHKGSHHQLHPYDHGVSSGGGWSSTEAGVVVGAVIIAGANDWGDGGGGGGYDGGGGGGGDYEGDYGGGGGGGGDYGGDYGGGGGGFDGGGGGGGGFGD